MRVRLTPRALLEIERKATWWRRERPAAASLFEDELVAKVAQALVQPNLGSIYKEEGGVTIRRLLLPRTRNHVYYVVDGDELVVLSAWGAADDAVRRCSPLGRKRGREGSDGLVHRGVGDGLANPRDRGSESGSGAQIAKTRSAGKKEPSARKSSASLV